MKYTIEGFNQEKAIEYGLNVSHLVILRWIVDFSPKMSKEIIDSETYYWVNYKAMLEDIPILNIKKRALEYKLGQLVKAGVLIHQTIKRGGTYSYYGFGENYIYLISKQRNSYKSAINLKGDMQNNAEQNNYSTKENNNTIYTPIEDSEEYINTRKENFELIWDIYPKKENKQSAFKEYYKAFKRFKNRGYEEDNLINREIWCAVNRYAQKVEKTDREERYIKSPNNFFANIEDYI